MYDNARRQLAHTRAMGRVFEEQNAAGVIAAIDALRGDYARALTSFADIAKPVVNSMSLLGAAAVAEATGEPG